SHVMLFMLFLMSPDVSVVSSSVSGHEGGDISVQCFYSSGYQDKLKQWCRYKDQSCYTVGRTDTSQNSSVQISDDDDGRTFTVVSTVLDIRMKLNSGADIKIRAVTQWGGLTHPRIPQSRSVMMMMGEPSLC
uniref:Immunoglobulin V-set domain-containing protein n=1 Tax=Sinocyclocheilus anshuiensis TaxID=1608454 RepID=A0A671SMD2_9TELE